VTHLPGDGPERFVCEVSSPHVDLELEPWHIGRAGQLYDAIEADSDVPPARVMTNIRRRSYVEGGGPAEDSYAAYCFYGDLCARVERT
jgi:hypothetical protein